MLKIKNVSAKNFMSVGNNTQAVNFDNCQLTLVLGHNLDMGGDGAFVSIMCYAWPVYLNRPKVRKKNPNALSQLTDAH